MINVSKDSTPERHTHKWPCFPRYTHSNTMLMESLSMLLTLSLFTLLLWALSLSRIAQMCFCPRNVVCGCVPMMMRNKAFIQDTIDEGGDGEIRTILAFVCLLSQTLPSSICKPSDTLHVCMQISHGDRKWSGSQSCGERKTRHTRSEMAVSLSLDIGIALMVGVWHQPLGARFLPFSIIHTKGTSLP